MLVIYNIIRGKTDKVNNRGAGVLFTMAVPLLQYFLPASRQIAQSKSSLMIQNCLITSVLILSFFSGCGLMDLHSFMLVAFPAPLRGIRLEPVLHKMSLHISSNCT